MATPHFPDAFLPLWFAVAADGQADLGNWQTCTGLVLEYDVKQVVEGGENNWIWRIPGRLKATGTVKLTRALDTDNSAILKWLKGVRKTAADGLLKMPTVTITLFHGDVRPPIPKVTWELKYAYPSKWTGPSLDVNGRAIATETLELVYHDIECLPQPGARRVS